MTNPAPAASLQTVTITIPIDLHPLTKNRRSLRWQVNHGRSLKAKDTAYKCWLAAGRPHINGAVVVDIEYRHYRARRYDSDAIVYALHGIRDSLFVGAITKTDSPKWCHFRTPIQVREPQFKDRPEVVFHVTATGIPPMQAIR